MWNIAGVPMVVQKWTPKTEEERQEEEAIPMWVHSRNVPLHMFSWEALSFVTSPVGFPVKLHPETLACENFEIAKIFVKVDVSKTLPKEITFIKDGKEFTVVYHYPWLPMRCNLCDKWGHGEKVCVMKRKEKQNEEESDVQVIDEEEPVKNNLCDIVEQSIGQEKRIDIEETFKKKEGRAEKCERSMQSESSGNRKSGEILTRKEASQGVEVREWSPVSPGRVDRNLLQEDDDGILISASKFFVLNLDVEEGEILVDKQNMEETNEEKDQRGELESDLLEDNILSQSGNEKIKSVT